MRKQLHGVLRDATYRRGTQQSSGLVNEMVGLAAGQNSDAIGKRAFKATKHFKAPLAFKAGRENHRVGFKFEQQRDRLLAIIDFAD